MEGKRLKNIFKVVTIVVTILLLIFIVYALKLGIFKDKDILVQYIQQLGVFAPIFFLFLQAVQVVFPVIPGGASCLAGVLAFGSVWGFIYNYIGLVIGSIISFILSRKYGIQLVRKLFKEETVNQYLRHIQTNKFDKIFFLGIFLPGFPDDLLCYIAGVSQMSLRKFILLILLGKPFALLFYSFFIELF